ncbi:hypothetical protein, partial [Leptospira borgpetersenii]|uniref:hypothetical protein n=1 Tax=Leptospira borgpetersenii TaxID=174 RepID=UPI001E536C6B
EAVSLSLGSNIELKRGSAFAYTKAGFAQTFLQRAQNPRLDKTLYRTHVTLRSKTGGYLRERDSQ